MKITFIHHSSFWVECEKKIFLFDYFRKNENADTSLKDRIEKIDMKKQIYIFSSHMHGDHFDLEVLRWGEKYPNIQYVFSKDIRLGNNYLKRHGIDPSVKEKITFLPAEKKIELDEMEIETLLSTDEGVAFLITYNGKTIYHGGDLNWWHWEGEEEAFLAYQAKTYQQQIDKLKGRQIDLAFVVLDPRLGDTYFWGMDYFLKQVDVSKVIPMHLWEDYALIKQYKSRPKSRLFQDKIVEISNENQVFTFS